MRSADFAHTMLATDHYPSSVAMPNHELPEFHRSKISLHRAKLGYDYPTIRLPHTFSRLVGLSTRIYQTIQEGTLAFLVVVSPKEDASKAPKSSVFTPQRSPVQIRLSISFLLQFTSFHKRKLMFNKRACRRDPLNEFYVINRPVQFRKVVRFDDGDVIKLSKNMHRSCYATNLH
jgi:hypothetical protein